jgi:voltage-gated potassium channel
MRLHTICIIVKCFAYRLAMLLLSPTRLLIDCLKRRPAEPEQKAKVLLRWNRSFFWWELFVAAILSISSLAVPSWSIPIALGYFLIFVSASRCNEIVYAFLRDASRQLEQAKPITTLKPGQRIKMAMRSYVGLLINFGVIYYFVPKRLYDPVFKNFVEAFYFSGVTLATLGYGDIKPIHYSSQLLALYEVFAGMLLMVVALAVYLSAHDQSRT